MPCLYLPQLQPCGWCFGLLLVQWWADKCLGTCRYYVQAAGATHVGASARPERAGGEVKPGQVPQQLPVRGTAVEAAIPATIVITTTTEAPTAATVVPTTAATVVPTTPASTTFPASAPTTSSTTGPSYQGAAHH